MNRLGDFTNHIEVARRQQSIARAVVAQGRRCFNDRMDAADAVKDDAFALGIVRKGVIERSNTSIGSSATYPEVVATTLSTIGTIVGPSSGIGMVLANVLGVSVQDSLGKRVPLLAVDGTGFGYYGEGTPMPAWQGNITEGVTVSQKKCGGITMLTREVVESTDALPIVREAITRNTTLGIEDIFFGTGAGDTITPPGIFKDVTPLSATAGGGITALDMDVGALASTCSAIGGMQLLFVGGPAATVKLMLRTQGRFPFPLASSSALPDDSLACIATNGIVIGGGLDGVTIDISKQAVLHADTEPTQLSGDATATPVAAAYPVRSLFQIDAVAVRIRASLDWAVRAAGSVAIVNEISW